MIYKQKLITLMTIFSFMSVGWGQVCDDGVEVELWGECYNIEETTSLVIGQGTPGTNGNITGSIPSSIGNLINLTSLSINSQSITGSIPSSIGNLINLTDLDIHPGQGPDHTGGLVFSELTGLIPSSIGNLINLNDLKIFGNNITGSIPSSIGNLVDLTNLYLSWNNITGSIPTEIGNLMNLEVLNLENNQLTGEIPIEIGDLMNLSDLDLTNNQLSSHIPESICNLVENDCSIGLNSNQLCPPYPECINSVGYQNITGCPGQECQIGNYNGYNDCSQNCITLVYFENWLEDDECNESGIDFNCYYYGYDCGDCGEYEDNPSGFCFECSPILGDINNDNILDILDIVSTVNCILSDNCNECSDMNGDEIIDILDIVLMVNVIMDI